MPAYYNENDPYPAQWLRNLIAANLIAPGEVDERDIRDVLPDDLNGFEQCHFFAGIGVWSAGLRGAGWPDSKSVWTGSCPCQPFSAAGQGGGFDDERHLWPAWFYLIEKLRPRIIFGEQVASPNGLAWIDLVSDDLEGTGYACAPLDLCAAGFGAPHIRQRLDFVAERLEHDEHTRLERLPRHGDNAPGWPLAPRSISAPGDARGLANSTSGNPGAERQQRSGEHGLFAEDGSARGMGDGESVGWIGWTDDRDKGRRECASRQPSEIIGLADDADGGRIGRRSTQASDGGNAARFESERLCNAGGAGPVNGFWRAADWIFCRDERWRPIEPESFPLAHGVVNRVGKLRAYGNALVLPQTEEFIKAYMAERP